QPLQLSQHLVVEAIAIVHPTEVERGTEDRARSWDLGQSRGERATEFHAFAGGCVLQHGQQREIGVVRRRVTERKSRRREDQLERAGTGVCRREVVKLTIDRRECPQLVLHVRSYILTGPYQQVDVHDGRALENTQYGKAVLVLDHL